MSEGYFSDPAIQGSSVVFVSEDDLWLYNTDSKSPAVRITTSDGQIRNPLLNHDGTKIAYSSNEYGSFEVFVYDLTTAEHKRLTYFGGLSITRYWDTDTDEIVFSSNYGVVPGGMILYKVSAHGGEPESLPYGQAMTYSKNGNNITIGRFRDNIARWKGYKGGTTGQIWFTTGDEFEKIDFGIGNFVNPLWIGDYIYYLTDVDGIGNLYRINPINGEKEQLTHSGDYYFRKPQTDGRKIILQKGGSLLIYDISSGDLEELEINYISSREVRKERFLKQPEKYLTEAVVNKDDTHVMTIIRGKPFYFPFWEEGTIQIGELQGVRYRHPVFHPKEDLVYIIGDELGEDGILVFDLKDVSKKPEPIASNIGIPYSMKINATGTHIGVFNNRMEVVLIDLSTKKTEIVKEPGAGVLGTFDFTPDGKWLAYTKGLKTYTSTIFIYSIEDKTHHEVTTTDFDCFHPRFSPDGKYLFFLSNRSFYPTENPLLFQYDFPKTTKVYALTLNAEDDNPVIMRPRPLTDKPGKSEKNDEDGKNNENGKEGEDNGDEDKENKGDVNSKLPEVKIDFDSVTDRIIELPIPVDKISQLEVGSDRLYFRVSPVKGAGMGPPGTPDNTLKTYIFKDQKVENVSSGIISFSLSSSKSTLVVYQKQKVRLLPASHLESMDKNGDANKGNTRVSKYLNTNRLKVKINPQKEWEQMVKETWKLMKDHYWQESIAGVNWELMLEKYLKLVAKISSRSELSDLLWELQAETRTSHSYEFGGDYEFPPNYSPAYLGAEYRYNLEEQGYEITKLLRGDIWDISLGNPLLRSNVKIGDVILAVDGQVVSPTTTIHELLMGKKGQEVYIKIRQNGTDRQISVKPVNNDNQLRYRDWVEENRSYVHVNSNGRVGYFHIPNMSIAGLQEFYRYFKLETQFEGLIVDIRNNGGGHTSELFLEKLARKRLGYDVSRYSKPRDYPSYTVPGAMVALTDQYAGSDGDIFSHGFKMLNLGKLIGTRTWGGVVGIWPKVTLVDGTIVTQPEYSFYFNDVGFGVENYGTDPDIEVDITPNDAMKQVDPQLDRAIQEVLDDLNRNPVDYPDFMKS